MAKEIERKFLIDVKDWNFEGTPVKMKQAYLSVDPGKVIRVRMAGNRAMLTIKGNLHGISRDEFEYEIPFDDVVQLMELREGAVVEKTRYLLDLNGKTWEIDVFEGENAGLVVAEIELESEMEAFEKPGWIGDEVSTDVRYYNFSLSKNPFSKWQ
ncbi:CYTH domain-containing protein [Roseimarinus sediminis]|uniref:CYTH domain-containing protein n=1 Tax=Roseimarinus sediminis TaxID=1610899 RepID=UPI003D21D5F8